MRNTCGVDGTAASCRTLEMGGLTWMAENLNYASPESSWCYGDKPDSCAKYGRLYSWSAALSACPSGWRLPTRQEWSALATAAGTGKQLRSSAGWMVIKGDNGNTIDCNGTIVPRWLPNIQKKQ